MSDSIIAILGMGFLSGAIVTLIILGAVHDERANDIDLDMRLYVPHRDRDRRSDKRDDEQMEAEREIEKHAERLGIKIGDK